jgi:CubicO group peptidase (beta-lactamase class C family)
MRSGLYDYINEMEIFFPKEVAEELIEKEYNLQEVERDLCGDVNSNVIDMFRWDRAMINHSLMNKESFEEFTTTNAGYGYGVFADDLSILHGGSTDVFNAYNSIYLTDNMTIVVLVNKPDDKLSSTVIAGNLRRFYLE